MVLIDFHSISFPTMKVNVGDQQLFGSSKFFKMLKNSQCCGFNSQRTHILTKKKYNLNAL